jgi:2-polyprenyl-6-methoxyphenol hydroxylase-like FAD-dependent oxidoreductase
MRITCVGGGPAGLYFAILMKEREAEHEITVFERDPAGTTYGWGVTLWADLLEKLDDTDPESARQISESAFRWQGQLVDVQGKQTVHLGGSGFSISRQRILDILAKRAIDLGVQVRFETEVARASELPESDLIVACDGVNSRMRRLHADRFKTEVDVGRNKYVWLGTSTVFNPFTYAFVETDAGWIWFYGYGFSSEASTCVVECSPATWAGLGFDRLGVEESISLLERTFERYLDGRPLMVQKRDSGGMPWLNYQTITNRRWHSDDVVLMGDAAHTTHFSIGSGTRLAIEDAIALAGRLQEHEHLQAALEAYGEERRAALLVPARRARDSARWFENVPRYMDLQAPQFGAMLARRYRVPRLLAPMPPRAYYRLYEAARKLEVLRRLRSWLSSRPGLSRRRGG